VREFDFVWSGRLMAMDRLEAASSDLYGLPPREFIAVRDARVSDARKAGDSELASSLKGLRKPSVGAWLANLLARDHMGDVDRLIALGAELRAHNQKLDGEQIRSASKAKATTVTKLLHEAELQASRADQVVSKAALEELEATLDAAFSDEQAAESLREGRLTVGMHYSGLGFGVQPGARAASSKRGRSGTSRTNGVAAQRRLKQANQEVDQADADLAKVRRAVADAKNTLSELKAAEALAVRRSTEAHKNATAAEKTSRRRS
jgi:hypothetical protein